MHWTDLIYRPENTLVFCCTKGKREWEEQTKKQQAREAEHFVLSKGKGRCGLCYKRRKKDDGDKVQASIISATGSCNPTFIHSNRIKSKGQWGFHIYCVRLKKGRTGSYHSNPLYPFPVGFQQKPRMTLKLQDPVLVRNIGRGGALPSLFASLALSRFHLALPLRLLRRW